MGFLLLLTVGGKDVWFLGYRCSAGSWDPNKPTKDAWGEPGGRLMMTSLSCLTLEVYYRYLPLYKLDQDGKKAAMEEL